MSSYVVYALKWRPQDFDSVVGQNHITSTLKNAIQKNRLAHAYLFAGPRGVGKTSTARILSRALNCKDGPTITPCGQCASCKDISAGRSMDVIEIDGASNRGIEEIRVLRENIKFSPVSGKFKVYIIDEVHMLTPEAFNALLKTLEEPPEFVKFIFATTQPNKVLPTILSRCQRFDFRRIPVLEIIAQLERITTAEKVKVDKDVLFAIAKSSDGALRDAESILDQLVSFSQDGVSLKDVVSVLGLVEHEALFDIAEKIIQKDAKAVLGSLNDIIDDGKDLHVFLANLLEHFRNLMIAKITHADPKLIDLPQEICDRLLQQSQSLSLEEIFSAFNIMVNIQEMSKRLESLRIPLEVGLVRLAHRAQPAAAATRPTVTRPPVAAAPQAPVRPQAAAVRPPEIRTPPVKKPELPITPQEINRPEPPVQGKQASLDDVRGIWKNIIEGIGRVKMSVATYMSEGSPLKVENNVLTISFPKNYSLHKESLERKDVKAMIENAISEMLSAKLRICFILSQDVAVTEGRDSPIVKSVMETFHGRLIKED